MNWCFIAECRRIKPAYKRLACILTGRSEFHSLPTLTHILARFDNILSYVSLETKLVRTIPEVRFAGGL